MIFCHERIPCMRNALGLASALPAACQEDKSGRVNLIWRMHAAHFAAGQAIWFCGLHMPSTIPHPIFSTGVPLCAPSASHPWSQPCVSGKQVSGYMQVAQPAPVGLAECSSKPPVGCDFILTQTVWGCHMQSAPMPTFTNLLAAALCPRPCHATNHKPWATD